MSLPLQIYDFLAILLPATVLVTIMKQEFQKIPICQDITSNSGIVISLITLYLMGLVLSVFSSRVEKWKYTSWIFRGRKREIKSNQIALNGRKKQVIFSEKMGNAILEALTDFYGFNVEKDESNLFELVFTPIYDRVGKRDIFLALSNMTRSLTVICIVFTVFYAVKYFIPVYRNPHTLLMLVVSIISFIAFKKIFMLNSKYAEAIPYCAFLAWYNEKIKQR